MYTPGAHNQALIQARLLRHLSQKELAAQLGVSPSSIIRWENGDLPTPYLRKQLGIFLGQTEAALFPQLEQREASPSHLFLSLPSEQKGKHLVGREQELADLRTRLCDGDIVPLIGLPGVGKTTLATALAYDPVIQDTFPYILWANVGFQPQIADQVRSWGQRMGVGFKKMAQMSLSKLIACLKLLLQDQPLLLILDDAWRYEDVEPLLSLQEGTLHIRSMLITSRFPVLGAAFSHPLYPLQELTNEAGFSLLQKLSPRVTEREPGKMRELVRVVGGLPLALTLMAHYLENHSWSGQRRRITSALAHLGDEQARLRLSVPGQPSTLESVIALTERMLNTSAQEVLAALALFPPKPFRFSEETALAVTHASPQVLDRLEDLGLLECLDERYAFHQTIRDYAKQRLTPARQALIQDRLLTFVASHQPEATTWFIQEQTLVLFALDVAYEAHKDQELLRLTAMFAPAMVQQGWLSMAQQALTRAVSVADTFPEPPEALSQILLLLGDIHLKVVGGNQQTFALFSRAIALARSRDDQAFASEALANLAWYSHLYGEYAQADRFLQEGLELATASQLPNQLWLLYRVQGSQWWARGDYQEADRAYQTGLHLLDAIDEKWRWQVSLYECFLAVMEGERGHYAQAEMLFARSLEACERYRIPDFSAFVLARRAMMRLMIDPSEHLREELLHALRLAGEANGFGIYVHKALAQLELLRGNLAQAEEHARIGLQLIEPFETLNRQAEHRTLLAQIALAYGDYEHGWTEIEEVLPIIRTYGAAEDCAIAYGTAGELALARGDLGSAHHAFEQLFAFAPLDFVAGQALGHYGLARIAAAHEQWEEAQQEGETSLRQFDLLHHLRAGEVRTWLSIYQTHFGQPTIEDEKEIPH